MRELIQLNIFQMSPTVDVAELIQLVQPQLFSDECSPPTNVYSSSFCRQLVQPGTTLWHNCLLLQGCLLEDKSICSVPSCSLSSHAPGMIIKKPNNETMLTMVQTQVLNSFPFISIYLCCLIKKYMTITLHSLPQTKKERKMLSLVYLWEEIFQHTFTNHHTIFVGIYTINQGLPTWYNISRTHLDVLIKVILGSIYRNKGKETRRH